MVYNYLILLLFNVLLFYLKLKEKEQFLDEKRHLALSIRKIIGSKVSTFFKNCKNANRAKLLLVL